MSQVSIFELTTECFFEIFKYIKENCEREKPNAPDEIKYEDFIRLAICCDTFDDLIQEWKIDLYDRLWENVSLPRDKTHIDFEEVNGRLKRKSAKEKETYWRELSQAIRKSPYIDVDLFYAPKSFHSDHMEAFRTVIAQLQNKPNLKELHIDVRGYTLEGLGALRSLEELTLNVRMDIDDLIEICRLNENLRFLEYMNNETGGKRLAEIAPHCRQLEELTFKMRTDCDASEYRPLAKIPRLQYLQIAGVHEKGTLQHLLEGLACTQSKVLDRLSIDEATLDHNETQAMAQIETLTRVECGFDDPQSIGLLSQLPKLKNLKILSKHDSRTLCEQALRILVESKGKTGIELDNSSISYGKGGNLTLFIKKENVNDSDYSSLLSTLPSFTSLAIDGICSLKSVFNGFRNAPTMPNLLLGDITDEETAALSEIASLKRLTCRLGNTNKAELLAKLPELEELTVSSSYGSLQGLLDALSSRESQTLQKLCLKVAIDAVEAKELARLKSLRALECQFDDPLNIQLLSELTELEELKLIGYAMLDILPGALAVTKSCKKLARVWIYCDFYSYYRVNLESWEILVEILKACQDKIDLLIDKGSISFNREKNKLHVDMFLVEHKQAIESLARLESVNHMELVNYGDRSLRQLFAALAMKNNSNLQSLNIPDQLLKFDDTVELAKIPSLTKFRVRISEASFQHLLHLSNFVVEYPGADAREITFDQSTGKLSVSLLHFSMKDINPLASLQNLRHVTFSNVRIRGSMLNFLGQLAACQGETLQELRVDNPYKMSNEELREVSRMKSLRTLVCSVSHAKNIEIEQLAQLPQLAVLVVGSHRAGSLKNLLGILSASKCPTLVHLAVRGASLTPQEVTEVSAIGSLKGLECAFCSTEGLEVLSQRNCIEHLGITTREGEASLVDVLSAFASSGESNIQKLTIDGLAVGQESITVLNLLLRNPKLKSLKLPIKDTQGIEGLAESMHLEDLTISCFPKRGSLAGLFRAFSLNDSTKLNNLVIERTFIDLEETRQLAQVGSITRLKCGFRDGESFSLLAKMTNLENLEVTSNNSYGDICDGLLDIFQECRKLKSIFVGKALYSIEQIFLKKALDILKSVRDPSTQGPLEIRVSSSSYDYVDGLTSRMTAFNKTYLIVTNNWKDSKDEPESDEERDKESAEESEKESEEESEEGSEEESDEDAYPLCIGQNFGQCSRHTYPVNSIQ